MVPPEARGWVTEARAYLPLVYFASAYELSIPLCSAMARASDARQQHACPARPLERARGTVFACFNFLPKIEQVMFGNWLAVLTRVPGSVIVLLQVRSGTL